jgi:hypothetical protein
MNQLRYNPFLIVRTLFGGFAHAGWAEAWHTRGVWGLLSEFLTAVAGLNTWPFFIVANYGWSPGQVRRLLAQHGIASWGWGYHDGNYLCRVPMRQAHWAQYLLFQHAVPITGRLLMQEADGGYAAHHSAHETLARSYPAAASGSATSPVKTPAWNPLRAIDAVADAIAKL